MGAPRVARLLSRFRVARPSAPLARGCGGWAPAVAEPRIARRTFGARHLEAWCVYGLGLILGDVTAAETRPYFGGAPQARAPPAAPGEDRAALVARGFEPCACSPLARPITPPPGRDRLSRGDWTVLAILWLFGLLAVGLLMFRSR